MPAFMPISPRIGPLTTTIAEAELDVLLRAVTCEAASARMTGKYSGLAPAMTAFTATFSTVYSHETRNSTGCMRPTISSGLRLVCASIAATRFSVGRTMGSPSVQLFSRNWRCRLSSVSGSSRRGVVRSNVVVMLRGRSCIEHAGEPGDDLLHDRAAGEGIVAIDVGLELGRALAHDRLRHEGALRLRQARHLGDRLYHLVELVGVQRDRRHAVSRLERDGVGGDARRAGAAVPDADDRGV